MVVSFGGGGGGAGLPDQTGHAGEFLSTDGTNPSWQAVSSGGTATVSWFDNQSGTTLSTGLTIPSSARVQVYKNGKLLQAGQAITAKLFTGGSGKSLSLAQTAPISTANSWLFETELLWDNSTSGSTPCVLCYTGTSDCKAPVIIYEVKMGWYLSSNGSNWDIDTANNSSMNLPDSGYRYKFRAEFTGSSYILSYKKGVADWEVARELNSTTKLFCDVPFMLLNSAANPGRCYNGSTLNMAKTKFIIDGQTWFDGATAVLGTDYTNDGCTMTEEASSTNDYVLDTTTGVITFADALNGDDIAVEVITSESGTGGTTDYTDLTNKPSINSVTLTGNKSSADLHLQGATSIVTLTTASTELATNTIYNGGELSSVTLTLPATVPADFIAQVEFTSGAIATTFTAPATVIFEGNDCSNGVFTPLANKRYSVMVYSDGVNVIGLVMGN